VLGPRTLDRGLDTAVGGTANDMTHAYTTTSTTDRGIRYWQVYEQQWRTVHAQSEIPARDWPTMNDEDSAMFRELPPELDEDDADAE
jgi:hypothetical protein